RTAAAAPGETARGLVATLSLEPSAEGSVTASVRQSTEATWSWSIFPLGSERTVTSMHTTGGGRGSWAWRESSFNSVRAASTDLETVRSGIIGATMARRRRCPRFPAVLKALLLAVVLAVAASWRAAPVRAEGPQGYSAEEAGRLRRAVTLDNWDDGGALSRLRYLPVSEAFPVPAVARGGAVAPLAEEALPAIGRYVVDKTAGRALTLEQALDQGPFDGFVVLRRGRIVYERYPRMRPSDRHLMFSVTKAFVGMAVALLEDRGLVRLDGPTAEYVPELAGSARAPIPRRAGLELAAGISAGRASGA